MENGQERTKIAINVRASEDGIILAWIPGGVGKVEMLIPESIADKLCEQIRKAKKEIPTLKRPTNDEVRRHG